MVRLPQEIINPEQCGDVNDRCSLKAEIASKNDVYKLTNQPKRRFNVTEKKC